MSGFLERFKGKTSLMGKEGITGLHNSNDKPIDKPLLISIINEKESHIKQKTRSLNDISLKHPNLKNSMAQRNFHSISSQSNKPSHFIQAAKNSIGMSTFDFAPERNNFYSLPKEPKIQYSASPFPKKNIVNKNKDNPISMSLDLNLKKDEPNKSNHFRKENSVGVRKNKYISVINEQNEEPDDDFEEVEKKHLEFLTMIEKMNLK